MQSLRDETDQAAQSQPTHQADRATTTTTGTTSTTGSVAGNMSQGGQATGGGTAGQATGGGNQPAVGARSPGKQRQNQILNYDDVKDLKCYKLGTASLEGDEYDGKNLSTWLKILQAKAKQYNWMNILIIDVGNRPVPKSLIQHYGEITRSQVRQHALTYLGTGNRQDQNSEPRKFWTQYSLNMIGILSLYLETLNL